MSEAAATTTTTAEAPLTRVPPMPGALRIIAGVLSGLVGASSAWLLLGSLTAEPAAWMPAGFWMVSIAAALIGVLLGCGRFAAGPGMAAFCVGSTIVGAAGFGRLSEIANISAVLRDPYFVAHVGVGLAICSVGGLAVLVRRRGSFRSLLLGGGLAGFSLGAVGVCWIGRDAIMSIGGVLGAVVAVVGIMAAIAIAGCFCAGVHFVVRAFEHGSVEPVEAPEPG